MPSQTHYSLQDLKAYVRKLNMTPRYKVRAMLEDETLHTVTIGNGPLTTHIYQIRTEEQEEAGSSELQQQRKIAIKCK